MVGDAAADEPGVVTKLSPRPVADTAARLVDMLGAKGVKLFAVIDQSAEARQAGLRLRDTTLVIFGSPAAGTPVMAASPLAALDLPLKVLVWDDAGRPRSPITHLLSSPPAIGSAPTWRDTLPPSTRSPTPSSLRRCRERRPRPRGARRSRVGACAKLAVT
jgi:hypothetical protein